jgi:signal peptide peptidase SppA
MSRLISYMTQTAWLLDEAVLDNLSSIVIRHAAGIKLDAPAVAAATSGKPAARAREKVGNVAVIPVNGVISKYSAGVSDISQPAGSACDQIRDDLRAALADVDVAAIMLDCESPGGSVDGIAELADEIADAKNAKPLVAYCSGQCCSAAYWLACQASEVVASKTSAVGSIGVYSVVIDSSRAAESNGYKVNVVKAGAYKAGTVRGAPVTPEALADTQRGINSIYSMFVDAVAAGRGITNEQALALADGRVHIGASALAIGLVDSIATREQCLANLQARADAALKPGLPARSVPAKGPNFPKGHAMTEIEFKAAEAKRIADIKAAFADDAVYALDAIASGKTLLEAQAAYAVVLKDKLAAQAAAHAEAIKAAAAQPAAGKTAVAPPPGTVAVGTKREPSPVAAAASAGDAQAQFDAAFEANLKKQGNRPGARARAMHETIAKHPDLHREVIAAANADRLDPDELAKLTMSKPRSYNINPGAAA